MSQSICNFTPHTPQPPAAYAMRAKARATDSITIVSELCVRKFHDRHATFFIHLHTPQPPAAYAERAKARAADSVTVERDGKQVTVAAGNDAGGTSTALTSANGDIVSPSVSFNEHTNPDRPSAEIESMDAMNRSGMAAMEAAGAGSPTNFEPVDDGVKPLVD
jgi:hypothetical protein